MSLDLDVGFKKEPKGIVDFLARQGYVVEDINKKKCLDFESEAENSPSVSYYPKISKESSSEWMERGANGIVSEINLYFAPDANCCEVARELAEKIVKKYNGVYFDPVHDELTTKSDLFAIAFLIARRHR